MPDIVDSEWNNLSIWCLPWYPHDKLWFAKKVMVNDFPTFMQKYLTRIQNKIFENQILSCWLPSWWRTNEHWESVQKPCN
jgi:hypothetical protein